MSTGAVLQTKPTALLILMGGILAAWLMAQSVLEGAIYLLMPAGLIVGTIVLYRTMKNWREGVLIFVIWMLFEDLARKFMGNNMAIYFAKDVLAAACLLSFYNSRRHERTPKPRPEFFLPFAFFVVWSTLEVFNPNSPSVWYGLVGLNLYFAYVPLFFIGYALLRNETDLRRFLLLNLIIAAAIAMLGVGQGLTGQTLLAPANLAPDLRELGTLMREAPTTHERFIRTTSVFVSDGRFAQFLVLEWLLGLATAAYFFVRRLPKRGWVLACMAELMAAILLSGSRAALVSALASSVILAATYIWQFVANNPRMRKSAIAVCVALGIGVGGVATLWSVYPEAFAPRVEFYQQTLSPNTPYSELRNRAWDYPIANLEGAFAYPDWVWGGGTGTRSLGGQYVTRILGASQVVDVVESGYGNLLLEMGIPGVLLWLTWTTVLMLSQWQVLRRLRGTPVFCLGFSILSFSFLVLFPGMASGLTGYQNFVTNSFLWLLLGIFFALPAILNVHAMPLKLTQQSLASSMVRRPLAVTPAIPVRNL